ncbi:conserved protein of unknown function [Hyphomicrobium sp. 1Nfss2.1]|uniref:hypothetical protein n=1 Tax=Hyphomicrobium sp. 1Nfss2.1 TaxID=3413936 RepID=UPI003C7CB8E6
MVESFEGPHSLAVLPIHFDVRESYLRLATFVETARQTQAVIEGLNHEIFGGGLSYRIFVLPPEAGSFKSRLGIWIVPAALSVLWIAIESDVGKAFIKGLTTHEPAYWAELAGEELREQLDSFEDRASLPPDKLEDVGSRLVVEVTRGFLQTEESALRRAGITARKFRESFEARNAFYEACLRDPAVEALGFRDEEQFPIERSDFIRFHVALPAKDEEHISWITGIEDIRVTSPNWDRSDNQRQWKGRNSRGGECFFRIEDESFWALVDTRSIVPAIMDTLRVQWAQRADVKGRSMRVLKVLAYNGTRLADPLSDDLLVRVLGALRTDDPHQGRLFGD